MKETYEFYIETKCVMLNPTEYTWSQMSNYIRSMHNNNNFGKKKKKKKEKICRETNKYTFEKTNGNECRKERREKAHTHGQTSNEIE